MFGSGFTGDGLRMSGGDFTGIGETRMSGGGNFTGAGLRMSGSGDFTGAGFGLAAGLAAGFAAGFLLATAATTEPMAPDTEDGLAATVLTGPDSLFLPRSACMWATVPKVGVAFAAGRAAVLDPTADLTDLVTLAVSFMARPAKGSIFLIFEKRPMVTFVLGVDESQLVAGR